MAGDLFVHFVYIQSDSEEDEEDRRQADKELTICNYDLYRASADADCNTGSDGFYCRRCRDGIKLQADLGRIDNYLSDLFLYETKEQTLTNKKSARLSDALKINLQAFL